MLKRKLNIYKSLPIYNVVVFGRDSTIKNVVHSSENFVITVPFLKETILNIENHVKNKMESNLQAGVVNQILSSNIEDPIKKQEHIQNIQNKYKSD